MVRRIGRETGFSLVELVVVIVIIGILAAIAIPRMSRGSTGASQSAVTLDLARMREAIAMYSTEHNGTYPGPTTTEFVDQLTLFSSDAGATQKTRDTTHRYGPYLVAIPACPVGENSGTAKAAEVLIDSANSPPKPNAGSGQGWVYNPTTGEILPNTDQTDDAGNAFTTY